MRLGGNVFPKSDDPEELVSLLEKEGYRAGYCPMNITSKQTDVLVKMRKAFEKKDIVIAEVGAWCNPMFGTENEKKKNVDFIVDRLAVAEELNARCCVNTVGMPNKEDKPDAQNYSNDFFFAVVDLARYLVDQVKPKKTKLALEITPFTFLDGYEGYLRFLKAVDRKEVAVHLDPANCIFTPLSYIHNAEIIEKTFEILAPYDIRSVHIKDLYMHPRRANVCIDEVIFGTGAIDKKRMFKAINRLPKDTPVMLEHMETEQEYVQAKTNARRIASEVNLEL